MIELLLIKSCWSVQWLKTYTNVILIELGQKGVKSLLAVSNKRLLKKLIWHTRSLSRIWHRELGSCACFGLFPLPLLLIWLML